LGGRRNVSLSFVINIDVKEKTIQDIIDDVSHEEEMIQFDEMIHEYQSDNKRAQVGVKSGAFGIRMWKDNIFQKDELYEGHSEVYAENAAENYVLGVKE